jgi:hypothetical protein
VDRQTETNQETDAMFNNDDDRERYLATVNDATAFALDEMIAEAAEAGDDAEVAKLRAERDALFLGHDVERVTLVRVELKENIPTPVAKAIYSDGSRLIVSPREAWGLAYTYQVPAWQDVEFFTGQEK